MSLIFPSSFTSMSREVDVNQRSSQWRVAQRNVFTECRYFYLFTLTRFLVSPLHGKKYSKSRYPLINAVEKRPADKDGSITSRLFCKRRGSFPGSILFSPPFLWIHSFGLFRIFEWYELYWKTGIERGIRWHFWNVQLLSNKWKKKKNVSRDVLAIIEISFFFVYLMDKWIKKWIIDFFVERSCKLNNKHKCNLYARGYKRA